MTNDEKKLPRGHAYIYMRNRGFSINIDYVDRDSAEAQSIIEAVMKIVRENVYKEEKTR